MNNYIVVHCDNDMNYCIIVSHGETALFHSLEEACMELHLYKTRSQYNKKEGTYLLGKVELTDYKVEITEVKVK